MSPASEARTRTVLMMALGLLIALPTRAEDVIVVRPKLPLRDKKVEGFDVDGVRLSGGTVLAWEEIESGRLDRDQARFDQLLRSQGEPMFRLSRALRVSDYRAAVEPAEQLAASYAGRRSKAAYLVHQGLMWGRLAEGRREEAVEPYLTCLEILRQAKERPSPPGPRRLQFDAGSGLTADLPAIFFNADAARAALPRVQKARAALTAPVPTGLGLFATALALAAGDLEAAEAELARVGDDARDVAELRRVLAARLDVARGRAHLAVPVLETVVTNGLEPMRPLARYCLGQARVASAQVDERRDGVIDLLHVPALHGETQPDLSAAALDLAARTLDVLSDPEAELLRKELLVRFPNAYHAARLRDLPGKP